MTVSELIDRLRVFDGSIQVMTPGFDEDGFDALARVEAQWVRRVRPLGQEGHCGSFNECEPDRDDAIVVVVVNF